MVWAPHGREGTMSVTTKKAPEATAEQRVPHTMATRAGWYIRICKKNTNATNISFEVGQGGSDESHRAWFTWNRDGKPLIDEYDFPADLIDVGECWFKGNSDGSNARVCLCFRDHVVKHMNFHKSEEHEKHTDDNDDCEC
jgi:hypothetical protein